MMHAPHFINQKSVQREFYVYLNILIVISGYQDTWKAQWTSAF